jgi:CRISPR-associated endonuclease Csn1
VQRAVERIWVSHKPDHGHEGALHNATAYGLLGDGIVRTHKMVDGVRKASDEKLSVIEITEASASDRHGLLADGSPRPYKGYKGDSNYCIEIVRNDKGRWEGRVVSTFEAHQVVRRDGLDRLSSPMKGLCGRPLVMRLMLDDTVRLLTEKGLRTMRVATISGNGQVFMADVHEANVDARNRDKADSFAYVSKYAGSFQKAKARRLTISPIGELRDPGWAE